MNKLMKRLVYIWTFFLMAAGGLQGTATNRYVATNAPGPGYPYDSWANAGTNIIEVVAVANANGAGDIVFVSNGTYYLTNSINISANVIVTNFTGDRSKVIINGNYPTTTNRCFRVTHANAIVSGFTITNGYANTNDSVGQGAGVYLYYGTIKDCLITGNRSVVTSEYTDGGGGGIIIWYGTATSCSVIGNICEGQISGGVNHWSGGGGIALNQTGMATNCYVAYNTATNSLRGGGVWLSGGNLLNCTIVGNVCGGADYCTGGGIILRANRAGMIKNCIIISNTADVSGGGIFIDDGSSSVQIRNCLIQANRCSKYSWGDGAGVYIGSSSSGLIIDSCTIVSNRFDAGYGYGGGICIYGTHITNIWNCIIYNNYAGKVGGVRDLSDGHGEGASKTAVVYSCTSPGSGFDIVGEITNSPPSFVDANNGNYRLRWDSPCINKGTNRAWMTNDVDLDGGVRIRYGIVDMGAYECIFPGTHFEFR